MLFSFFGTAFISVYTEHEYVDPVSISPWLVRSFPVKPAKSGAYLSALKTRLFATVAPWAMKPDTLTGLTYDKWLCFLG
jgi:hypothetical protein